MTTLRPLPCSFYCTNTGNEPVRKWLKELSPEDRLVIGIDIKAIQYGWPLGKPLVEHLGDGLWEVRSHLHSRIARVLFIITDGRIVLLHGFIKKTQRSPHKELQIARRRKREIEIQPTHRQ
jgi:phage-related protein